MTIQLTLEISALETLYSGKVGKNQIVTMYHLKHHSFFRNSPPLFPCDFAACFCNFQYTILQVPLNMPTMQVKLRYYYYKLVHTWSHRLGFDI